MQRIMLTFSNEGPRESVEHYLRCALEEYGPYLGLKNHPCRDGIRVLDIEWKEDKMARLRGRSISVKFDLQTEADDEDIVEFFFDAIEEAVTSASADERHPLKTGVRVRQITYNGEKWEV